MTDRGREIAQFLRKAGWEEATCAPLAGDASSRRYWRVRRPGASAVLMDLPAEDGEVAERFARIARWLRDGGYSAPATLAIDTDVGFLLSEDLGDKLFATLLDREPLRAGELYSATVDFLADLARRPVPPNLVALDGPALARLTDVVGEWYLPALGGASGVAATGLGPAIADAWSRLVPAPPILSLRDFHAGNLVWLPGRQGIARVGLLDFQDAVAAHPAYDVVSLLQDARRDVAPDVEQRMIAHYVAVTDCDPDAFAQAYALLGAQRGLRILGVFARLAVRDGKPAYLAHMPRVWALVARNLRAPHLAALRAVVAALPQPTPERIEGIIRRCSPAPTP